MILIVASGQQYNVIREKPSIVMLYTYIVIIIQVHQNRRKSPR